MKSATWKPAAGLKGLSENWRDDLVSGFVVSLLALPLSLGIAGASNFPPVMGVLSAIIGGILVSFFTNSETTIKGPAAGMIAICAGAVHELGHGDTMLGWHLALGAIVVAGGVQVLMGLLKVPRFSDFFPISAIHGMLAAIGIIIMAKQIHLAVGIVPDLLQGKDSLALLAMLPQSLSEMEYHIAFIGLVGLIIMFGWKYIPIKVLKKVPPALVLLLVAIVLGQAFALTEPRFANYQPLINPGDLKLSFNASFVGIAGKEWPVFLKYVIMFALVGSLESVLTVKAVDLLDPYGRKADLSRDVAAVGAGNIVSGLLGGLPMISEVARSASHINSGGKTRWANLFHGLFLLVFVLLISPIIKMIPVAALSAMLIYVGYRLASPSEFKHVYHIGKEQLFIFLMTIMVTLGTDLLWGIAAGIATKFIIQLGYGVKLSHIFSSKVTVNRLGDNYQIQVPRSAVFSNYLSLKRELDAVPHCKSIAINFSESPYVDHTVMENIAHFKKRYEQSGGSMSILGLDFHRSLSNHPHAARKNERYTVIV